MIELIAVLAIIGIMLAVASPAMGRAIQNSNIDQTTEKIRTIVSDIEICLVEADMLQPEEDRAMDELVKEFMYNFNANYASMTFDVDTLDIKANSFTVQTSTVKDAWGTPLVLYYTWTNNMFIVASAGPDTVYDFLTEKNPEKIDDVFGAAIIK